MINVLQQSGRPSDGAPPLTPRLRRWSRDEYERLVGLGVFEGQRVELLEGRIVEMPAQNNPHAVSTELAARYLRRAFGDQYWVRVQMPLALSPASEPEPDIAVVRGDPRAFTEHPTGAEVVVEVADTSLRLDRRRKTPIYGRGNIPEYWILNLIDRLLEVYRQPLGPAARAGRPAYRSVQILSPEERVAPLAAPQAVVVVADLLPRPGPGQ